MQLWLYKHYKGNTYRVLYIGKHSDTLEDYVVYQGQYNSEEFGNMPIRVKQKDLFAQMTEFEGKQVPRFTYIGE